MSLSPEERERYARHILLKEIGGPGQQQFRAATVAIVGMGGLGAPAALYLAAAGVGRLRLIDHDTVALSNLQRQVLYATKDIGALKVERAAESLRALNPHVEIEAVAARFAPLPLKGEASALLDGADVVLDGTDDFATRYAINAACRELKIPLVSGAVGRWEGQVATFKPGSPCYRCLVPEIPPNAETCAQVGVVGALTGVIGSMMALEAIKEITQTGKSLAGRLWLYDALNATSRTITLSRDPACPVCSHE